MGIWFVVRYIQGGLMKSTLIYAHNEKQAREVALFQLRCTGRSAGLRIVDAVEEKPEKKEQKKVRHKS